VVDRQGDEDDAANFAALCRGEELRTGFSARLSCRLEHRGEPYLFLMPAQVSGRRLYIETLISKIFLPHKIPNCESVMHRGRHNSLACTYRVSSHIKLDRINGSKLQFGG